MTQYYLVARYKFPGVEYAVDETGFFSYWSGSSEPPTVEEMDAMWPQVKALHANDEARSSRQFGYVKEADPLYMEWQAGEGTQAAWLEKREEIKRRFPFVSVPN